MKKSAVYTKRGDQGETSLVDGPRVGKDSAMVDLYGEVDELNSHIGLATSLLHLNQVEEGTQINDFLLWIQHRLFDLGSNLACTPEKRATYKLANITEAHVNSLEEKMDQMDSELATLKNFVLPGGHPAASALHVCRTVCRRVERKAVLVRRENEVLVELLHVQFLNRLSDYLFVLSRYVNKQGNYSEVLWNAKV